MTPFERLLFLGVGEVDAEDLLAAVERVFADPARLLLLREPARRARRPPPPAPPAENACRRKTRLSQRFHVTSVVERLAILHAHRIGGDAFAALLLAASSGVSMQLPTKEIVNVGPAPVGPYSPAVKAGGFIYVSGTLSQDDTGAIVGKRDVGAQTRASSSGCETVLDGRRIVARRSSRSPCI